MLDLKFVRENLDLLPERLATRGMQVDLSPFRALEEERRALILEIEDLRARRNAVSKEIAAAKRSGGGADEAVAAMRQVGDRIQELEARQRANDEGLVDLMRNIPNLPHPTVPVGKSEEEKMVPRILNPSTRGISMPNPLHGWATSSRRNPSTTLATGG